MRFSQIEQLTFWWPVKVRVPHPEKAGEIQEHKFKAQFYLPPQEERDAHDETIAAAKTDRERRAAEAKMMHTICVGWDEVEDDDKKPVPFSVGDFDRMLQSPHAKAALYAAYYEALAGVRTKN